VYSFIKKVKEHNPNAKIAITVGGGVPAKQYIKLAESLGLSAYVRDLIGISVTRINALILLNCVKELLEEKKGVKLYRAISSEIPTSAFKALKMIDSSDIIFVGGYFPGQSTIGPAALTAEAIKADLLLIATDVPGVFTKDPTKDPSAKKITQIRVKELKNLLIEQEAKPGTYKVMDLVGISIIERSKISTIIFDGRDPQNFARVLDYYINNNYDEIEKIGTIIVT